MKYFKLFFLLAIISCNKSSTKYNVVSVENINEERLEFAKLISHKLLSAQDNEGYYELKNTEATSKMIIGLNKEKQISSYESISGIYGRYEGLTFVQLLKPKDGTLYEFYRFKGKFSSKVEVEIRTTLDGNGKLTGFYIIKWKDNI